MAGQGALKRARRKKAQMKQAGKKDAKRAGKDNKPRSTSSLDVSMITEDDLLSFQLSHFGDDTKPETWFVDAETAMEYETGYEEEDDGLGYYQDGAKRTLTDEQIEMFRHSEIERLISEGRLAREKAQDGGESERSIVEEGTTALRPASAASSVESELVGMHNPLLSGQAPMTAQRPPSQSTRSETSRVTGERLRKEEVPYEERHKRKWEDYIEENDAVEGSLTHRRIVRELDEQKAESVELDY